ncbi:MAG TPA: glycosyltransferase family 39 protein [Methylomirabilota bacterium]|jgi:4-amino-4-deoxy-L-arabinose transferase-like glycosyltransferase
MRVRIALTAVLGLAGGLRLWGLTQNGFGNEYYAATVRSMAASAHNFFYASFDPAGFISVDKPPLGLWVQVASVKLLGFHGLAVLLPQALEGIAAVWILFHLVRARFGAPAGLLAALFLALTPVSVAIDRSSNLDSALVLVLLLASGALLRAAESGDRRWLVAAFALIGLGFNVKMLAAFVVLPAFVAVYLAGSVRPWRARLAEVALAGVVLTGVSLAWPLAYDLTPPEQRPYAGTTDRNSVLELAIGPYGIGRFVKQPRLAAIAPLDVADAIVPVRQDPPPEPRPRSAAARLFVRTPAGPLRLADGQLAGQVLWWLPLALVGLVAGALAERLRRPLTPAHLALGLWSGWALTYAVVYSLAGGFFHYYYLSTMAPPLAALAAVGVVRGWDLAQGERAMPALLLPWAVLVTAAWQVFVHARGIEGHAVPSWPLYALLVGVALAAAVLVALALGPRARARAAGVAALALGLAALLVLPVGWALSSVLVAGNGVLPAADVVRLFPADPAAARARRAADPARLARLIEFLAANRQGERYLLSTSTTMLAAPIIVRTGEPVMARGGFHGLDPILTPPALARLVETRQVRFVMLDDLSTVSRRLGAETAGRPIAEWVRAHGTPVDPDLWRVPGARRSTMRLYDLRPPTGVYLVGGPDMAPKPPHGSGHAGEAVAPLDSR